MNLICNNVVAVRIQATKGKKNEMDVIPSHPHSTVAVGPVAEGGLFHLAVSGSIRGVTTRPL